QALDVTDDVRARAGKADVCAFDPEAVDQMQDANLLVDRGAPNGWRLQAVPERLVVQHDRLGRSNWTAIPVVNKWVHASLVRRNQRSGIRQEYRRPQRPL